MLSLFFHIFNSTLNEENDMFKNTKIHKGKLAKRIVYDLTTGEPKPVERVDKNTNANNPNVGTYQEANNGDLIVKCHWSNDKPSIILDIYGDDNVKLKDIDASNFLINLNPLHIKWLTTKDNSMFLPKGCGWDGVFSESDKVKYLSLQNNLPKDLPESILDRISQACYYTGLKEVDKPWRSQQAKLKPILHVEQDFDLAIEIFSDNTSEVTTITEATGFEITKDTVKFILIKFLPLKLKGNEKFEWETIQINH